MKRKLLFALLSVLTLCTPAAGSSPVRVRFGVDWGYSPQVYQAYTATYCTTQLGYRVTDSGQGFDYYSNGYLLLGVGLEAGNHCAVYLKSGYMGLFKDFRVMPLLGEVQYCFRGKECDTPFVLLSGGAALNEGNFHDRTLLASIGAGYRHHLSPYTTLDIVAKLQGSNCSPQPYDQFEGLVPRSSIIYSNSHQFAFSLGVALYF